MKRGPNGVTVVEVLISLLLGMAVVSMGWRLLAKQSTVAARLVHQMEVLLDASVSNMRRMFMLSGAFVLAAIIALVALLLLR